MFSKSNKAKRRLLSLLTALLSLLMIFTLAAFAPMQEGSIFDAIDWDAVNEALIKPNFFGIPIILMVIGLTYGIGEAFDIHGKWQFVLALGLGLVFGGLYQVATAPLGYTWQAWFFYIGFGLAQGWIASLLYETAKDLIAKITGKMLGNASLGEG